MPDLERVGEEAQYDEDGRRAKVNRFAPGDDASCTREVHECLADHSVVVFCKLQQATDVPSADEEEVRRWSPWVVAESCLRENAK